MGVAVALGVGVAEGVAPGDREAVGVGVALAPGHVTTRSLLLEASAMMKDPLALGAEAPAGAAPKEALIPSASKAPGMPDPASVLNAPLPGTKRRTRKLSTTNSPALLPALDHARPLGELKHEDSPVPSSHMATPQPARVVTPPPIKVTARTAWLP